MQSKQLKLPPLSDETKILCFDLETNGLHGEAFAVGAVVMDGSGKELDSFTARCEIKGKVDPWVSKNVIPNITNMALTHGSYRDVREAFWRWYVPAEESADYVLVSNGYPVEYRFLLLCQEENLQERYWQHPFPLLDLSSLLIAAGEKPGAGGKLQAEIMRAHKLLRHHPLHDAKLTALTAFAVFRQAGFIKD